VSKGRYSRQKGKRGERLCRDEITEQLGVPCRRGVQFAGGAGSPDVVIQVTTSLHFEAKAVERLNLHAAMAQSIADAGETKLPLVWHKRSREDSLLTMRMKDFAAICREAMRLIEIAPPAKEQQ
jgi:hypothetical protein